jgi:uncharacterized protein YuzE
MMKISFDKKADAFAIVFKEGRVSRDDEIAKNVFAGFDRAGELVEIQILDISKTECTLGFSPFIQNHLI